ncbi:MAG: hypothetical protein HXX17_08090 [Geobacteraceae bacterium]|nr:hypothetical protein [Geobacteraceae bacterium]
MSEYNIKIIKAMNGYMVINNQNHDEIFIVGEEEHLGNAIMGALVSQKLAGVKSKETARMTTSEIDDLLYEKSKWEVERAKLREERERYAEEVRRMAYRNTTTSAIGAGIAWGAQGTSQIAQDNQYDAQRYALMAQNAGMNMNSSILDAIKSINSQSDVAKKKGIV